MEVLYSADSQTVFDLLVRQNGEVLMGTGHQGRLLSITAARLKKVLGETPDEQVTRIVSARNQITLATSNLGKLYRLSRDLALLELTSRTCSTPGWFPIGGGSAGK